MPRPMSSAAPLRLLLAAGLCAALPAFAQAGPLKQGPEAKGPAPAPRPAPNALLSLRSEATQGFQRMLAELGREIRPGTLPSGFPFDVADFSDLERAQLGKGFEVYSVPPQRLLAGRGRLEELAEGTGIWNFPVLVDGRPVALLEVAQVEGRWEVLGAGAAQLAQDLQGLASAYAQGGSFRFIRIYQATADLMEVRDGAGQARFVPLVAARQSLGLARPEGKESALAASEDLLPALQDAVRTHLAPVTR